MKLFKDILRQWVPIAAMTTLFCVLVYVAVQQALRHSANDPQIQIAEDAAAALGNGNAAETVVPASIVDMAQSLAPFLIVFDSTGAVLGSSGVLHGKVPIPQAGVFEFVRRHGEERVTWQPERGVRMASVIVRYNGPHPGFVLAARSLREVERREAQTGQLAGIGWLGILGVSLVLVTGGRISLAWEMRDKVVAVHAN